MNAPFDKHVSTEAELRERIRKLEKINSALMGRVERSMDISGTGFSLFQTAILLEDKVKTRTRDLESTLDDLSDAYARLQEARDEAETAKQNLTAAIEAVSEGFALFDDGERLVMCNAPFRALMPDIAELLVPGIKFSALAELFASSRYLVIDSRQTRSGWKNRRIELFRKPTASFIQQFLGDRWIQVSNKRTVAGATVVFQTDITDTVRSERIRHERQLDEQSKILQATIDHLPQGICMFSPDLRLRAWNSRFIELLSLPVRQVIPNAGFERLFETLKRSAFTIAPDTLALIEGWIASPSGVGLSNVEILRSDGLILSLNTNVMPDGGIVASFADVTQERLATIALREAKEHLEQRVEERTAELKREVIERRAIETELIKAKNAAEEANKGKTRFLAAASHDLLQPLNAARLFLTLLSDAGLDHRQSRLAERADNAFASVEQLLESLLDISRFDSGGVSANIATVSLTGLFETLAAEFQPLADQKGLDLVCVKSSLHALSDHGLLRRIVQNLLANAIRYTDEGRVLLGARRIGETVRIEVWDTGRGIPADKTQVIFEEFRRLHKESNGGTKSMGLGLAIVDRISRLLGHEIGVRSWPGKGSCFSISLPRAPAGLSAPQRRKQNARPSFDLNGITAIVIENDLPILEGMIELLQSRGMRAIPTVSADEAMEALESIGKTPELVVADYHLDVGTGLDAIMRLREACSHAIPAIVITADHTAEVEAGIARQNITLLHKPIRAASLFDKIDRLSAHW